MGTIYKNLVFGHIADFLEIGDWEFLANIHWPLHGLRLRTNF